MATQSTEKMCDNQQVDVGGATGKVFGKIKSQSRFATLAVRASRKPDMCLRRKLSLYFLKPVLNQECLLLTKLLSTKYNTSEEDIQYYWAVFDFYDKDKSGKIDINELEEIFQHLGQNPTQTELEKLISQMDVLGNPDGLISFEEFLKYMMSVKREKSTEELQEDIRDAFNFFDVDGDGRIEKKELIQILKAHGETFTESDVDKMFKICDINNDGTIDFLEFVKLVSDDSNWWSARTNATTTAETPS